ncbi:nucleotidyltransferase family protein [Marivita hallyeonensis]|uniref:MurNAc alpha-1-phosphate uridylyltransferase n=1 Tax=Marivita hallyeonensis TaxID=996342 RepID=A0A1M5U9G6_9RHOB|nr:nucleotidyltransferase family protein [Marivita hallyeonensis]SHH59607.1 MurNAc alpha-1-phosphate uridylyltransferase [Marivita hallyeonensis]
MPDAVMLFAAGFGTRMRPLTDHRPKPLIEVAGTPLIDHAMKWVRDFGPSRIVVNAHYKADQIERHFDGTDVRVVIEAPEILDTGGGLKAALPLLQADPVFTMNTDAVWRGPNPLEVLSDAWTNDMHALLLCVPTARAMGHDGGGDFDIAQDGTATWGNETIYSGVHILRTDLVSNRAEIVFSLKAVWDDLEATGALRAVEYPGLWCDVGHPGGIELAEAMLAGHDV